MPERVDFYVLGSDDITACHILACRLAEKGIQQGLRVALRTRSADETSQLDQLMWSFSGPSFVPHHTPAKGHATEASVLIGDRASPDDHRDLLISMTEAVPEDAESFTRVADLVPGVESEKTLGRQRYRQYRDRGPEPTIHNL